MRRSAGATSGFLSPSCWALSSPPALSPLPLTSFINDALRLLRTYSARSLTLYPSQPFLCILYSLSTMYLEEWESCFRRDPWYYWCLPYYHLNLLRHISLRPTEFDFVPAGELAEQLEYAPFPGEKRRFPKTLEERIAEVCVTRPCPFTFIYLWCHFVGRTPILSQ